MEQLISMQVRSAKQYVIDGNTVMVFEGYSNELNLEESVVLSFSMSEVQRSVDRVQLALIDAIETIDLTFGTVSLAEEGRYFHVTKITRVKRM